MKTLLNKVAMITGASRGVVKAIALRYASLGVRKQRSVEVIIVK